MLMDLGAPERIKSARFDIKALVKWEKDRHEEEYFPRWNTSYSIP